MKHKNLNIKVRISGHITVTKKSRSNIQLWTEFSELKKLIEN